MMLQPRIYGSSRAIEPSMSNLASVLNSLTLCSKHTHQRQQFSTTFVRHASHQAQGRANGPKDSAGRRLGAKKSATEYVIPGNIIFKQRGTKWFPGENVGMGKDHTIYATESGYVTYYRNPAIHPKRRYIGVALDKEGPRSKLPTPPNAPTRRRLGMVAAPLKYTPEQAFLERHLSENSLGADPIPPPTPAPSASTSSTAPAATPAPSSSSASLAAASTRKAGTYWMSNYEVGKAAERKGIVVKDFDRKDRWLAWRKRTKKTQAALLARAAKATRKTKGKKSNKGATGGVKRK